MYNRIYTAKRQPTLMMINEFLMNFPEVLLIDKMLLNHSYMYMFNMNTA